MEVEIVEVIVNILAIYYMFVFVFVGVFGSLAITLSEEVYDMECCISNKTDFIHCIFMYQFAIKYLLEDEINAVGIVILEIVTTLSAWFLNIGIFFILLFCLLIKGICFGFWLIFRKKNDDEENYKK